ncbi:MAG: hypothetical protein ACYC3B_04555 [Sedimentisphaerales bacterium]
MKKIILSCAVLTIIAGCKTLSTSSKTDYCYVDKLKLAAAGSTAFIELYNESEYPDIQAETTDILYHSILKKQLFTLNLVKQDSPAWKSIGYQPNSNFTLEQLYQLQQSLNTRAVLVGSVIDFQPYPHLSIAMRLKMTDLADGQTIWAAEQVWDSADKNIEHRVEKYIRANMRTDRTADREKLTFVSSKEFIKFVCYELAETMKNQ